MSFKLSRRTFTKALAGLVAFIPAVQQLVQPAVARACNFPPCCNGTLECINPDWYCLDGRRVYYVQCYCQGHAGDPLYYCGEVDTPSTTPC